VPEYFFYHRGFARGRGPGEKDVFARGISSVMRGHFRVASSEFVYHVQEQAQHYADYNAGDNGEVETEVFPLDNDVARQPAEMSDERDRVPEQHKHAGQHQDGAGNDKNFSSPG
jgi:hypothetical protein